jgi:excisionase family DNA binding protein
VWRNGVAVFGRVGQSWIGQHNRAPESGGGTKLSPLRLRCTEIGMHRRNLLTAPEAAERLGTTRWTLYRWIETGELRAYRVGRFYKFDPADIDRLIHSVAPEMHSGGAR